GDEAWIRPKELHDMLEFPPEIEEKVKPYVANYPLNLIDMKRLAPEVREKFTSDFRVVAVNETFFVADVRRFSNATEKNYSARPRRGAINSAGEKR
ncbi:MAG: hypothetical protein IJX36_03915, partial [Thermoguttaceae bacterium]|nr:hypothetical protein [Thermoguttaceae bacterium]